MSREIMFRIWDNDKDEWLSESDDDALTYYGFHLIGECMTVQSPSKWTVNGTVEQYTGLKDKNGKEIYEGDIVKQLMYVFEGKEHITTWVVRWNKENCCFELHYLSGTLFGDSMMADDEDYKVIGNIHVNPELLEGKK